VRAITEKRLLLSGWCCCCGFVVVYTPSNYTNSSLGLWPGVTLSARSDRPWKVGERLVKAFSPTSSATKVKFK